jgi:AmmeMemoRadiSam system protein A
MTPESDRRALLRLARDSIAAHLEGRTAPSAETPTAGRPGGAFVSIHNHGELRGCIGHIEPTEPVGAVIGRCAVAAAAEDPRFLGVTTSELSEIDIELSLLGALEPISSLDEIEIGRHGLVVEMGWHRGLLLPQVATEWGWDRTMFVAQTCSKAGLPKDAWQRGAKLYRFEAEVFGERDTPGAFVTRTPETHEGHS